VNTCVMMAARGCRWTSAATIHPPDTVTATITPDRLAARIRDVYDAHTKLMPWHILRTLPAPTKPQEALSMEAENVCLQL